MKSAIKNKFILTTTICAILFSAGSCFAQTNWLGGIHFNSGLPLGQLDDQIGREAYGLDGQIFYAPDKSPLAIGLDLSWMNYGNESREEPFSSTIPDVTIDVETMNNIVQGLFVLRGQMPRGPIQFYGDALIGFNYLYTETSISGTNQSEGVISHTNQDDVAFAYGVGGGVTVPVYTRLKLTENKKPLQVAIDGGVRYIRGGEAEYLKKGSIRREDGVVTFDTSTSRTDMVRMHLGVIVRF